MKFYTYSLTMLAACALCLLSVVPTTAFAQFRDPRAEEQMRLVQLSMPEVPLEMEASLRVLDRRGKLLNTVLADVSLTPADDGRTMVYRIHDRSGNALEEMTVTQKHRGETDFQYRRGDPLETAPLPDLFGPVQGADISWMELSFSFFWWPDPVIVGSEKVANRWECDIIELACPREYPGGWSFIRLWVAPAYNAVVRGEVWKNGEAIKRFEVKSVRKLRKVYMIGDMDVRNLVDGSRAQLKVQSMKMVSPDYTAEELEVFNAPMEW